MRKKILTFIIITALFVNLSYAQHIESVSDLKVEVYNKKNTMEKNAFAYTYLQNTLSDSEELIRNYELLNLDGGDLAHFLNHILDFTDTAKNVDSKFNEGRFDESIDELHRLESLKNSTESKKTVLVSKGYNEYYVDDILKNMERTIKLCGETNCLDLIKKSDDSNKLDEKILFLDYAVQFCCEYKIKECEKLNRKYEDTGNQIEINERGAENYEDWGDLNLTAARDVSVKLFSLGYYDKSIEYYDEGYNIYENVLGMRTSDAALLAKKMDDATLERSNVFQEIVKKYSIFFFISIITVVLGMRVTRDYRREIRLNRILKRFF